LSCDKVQRAIEHLQTGPKRQIHSVAGDLGLNDASLRQALHARGILTVGLPKTVEPIQAAPSAQEVLDILNEAGLNRLRTPHQVHLACRGAGHVRYKGLKGAVLQQGMTALAHNSAVLLRIRRQQLSKRAQKFRRLLGLKPSKVNEINHPKN
jgi:hypothetical protein